MSLPQHREEAVARLKEAAARMDQAREEPVSLDSLQEWLAALTDFSAALADIQEFNNESVHEKLHEIAARLGLRRFPSGGSP